MDIKKVLNEVTKEIEQSSSQQELQNVKVAYLGKKGKITELLKSLKDLSLEEKMFTEWPHKAWIKLYNMLIAIEEIKIEILEDYGSKELTLVLENMDSHMQSLLMV